MENEVLISHRSTKGLKHATNEDSILVAPDLKLCAIADGMSVIHGEIASQLAIKVIEEYLTTSDRHSKTIATLLHESVLAANFTVYRYALSNPQLMGMGTTLTAAMIDGSQLVIAHVGDSCCFKVGAQGIQKLTTDHSTLLNGNAFSTLTRSVGLEAKVEVDVSLTSLSTEEFVVICSDGLTNFLETEEILRLFRVNQAWSKPVDGSLLDHITSELIRSARVRGSDDDISVLIFRKVK